MPTITTSFSISVGANAVTARTATTNNQAIEQEVALAADDSDIEAELIFPIASLASGELWLISTGKPISVATNSTEGDDVYQVPAGGAIRVQNISVDIASIFCTNESADTDTILKIMGVRDATP